MFTGLVEGSGLVLDTVTEGLALRLVVEVPAVFGGDARIGESVALNGCCLTLIGIEERNWAFQAGPETLARTNLGGVGVGHKLNLERALRVGDRWGGHIVQGHIDGVGEVERIHPEGDWTTMWFRLPESLAPQVVPKGSIAVDGVSLTVVEAGRDHFSVALIPHTLSQTTLGWRKIGDPVNIETDIVGKYVQKLYDSYAPRPATP